MTKRDPVLLYCSESPSKNVTVSIYEQWVKSQSRAEIADFIYERHYRRYLKPSEFDNHKFKKEFKNGFAIMATCSLLIETIESFYRGWPTTSGKSELAFLKFFTRDPRFSQFARYDLPSLFYKHIRCGILHQGETTGGWFISRRSSDPLLSRDSKLINASKFLIRLKKSLGDYRELLYRSAWQSSEWENLRTKMNSIIKNCKA